jgi:hypothetical protein
LQAKAMNLLAGDHDRGQVLDAARMIITMVSDKKIPAAKAPTQKAPPPTVPAPIAPAAPPPSDETLDALILASVDTEWRHVAMLIARAVDAAKEAAFEVSGQQVAARIYALAEVRKVDVQGNIRRWRAGKIRAAGTVDAPEPEDEKAVDEEE